MQSLFTTAVCLLTLSLVAGCGDGGGGASAAPAATTTSTPPDPPPPGPDGGVDGGPTPTPDGKTWQPPVQLSTGDGSSTSTPDVALDASGNATAVWLQIALPANRNAAWASHYVANKAWSVAATIDGVEGSSSAPVVAVTPAGEAVAAFTQSATNAGGAVQLYAARFTSSWAVPTSIGVDSTTPPSEQRLTLAPDGSAAIAFLQSDGTIPRVRVTRGAPSGVWDANVIIDAASGVFPHVAVAANGHAIATWVETTGPSSVVLLSSRNVGAAWTTPSPIAPETGSISSGAHVVADANGNMHAVWSQSISGHRVVRAARLDDATGVWGAAVSLSDGMHDAYNEDLAADAKGNAVVVWYEPSFGVKASSFAVPLASWSAPAPVVANGIQEPMAPKVSVDGNGNAFAVWALRLPDAVNQRVYAAHLTSAGWGAPASLMIDPAVHAEEVPVIAANVKGEAVAVWRQGADSSASAAGIWASVYR